MTPKSPTRRCPSGANECVIRARQRFREGAYKPCLEVIEQGLAALASSEHEEASTEAQETLLKMRLYLFEHHGEALLGRLARLLDPEHPPRFDGERLVEFVASVRPDNLHDFTRALLTSCFDDLTLLGVLGIGVGKAVLQALSNSSILGVRQLSVWLKGAFPEADLRQLARSPLVRRCKALDIRGDRLTDDHVASLVPIPIGLNTLRLRSDIIGGVSPAAATSIAHAPESASLRMLGLVGTRIGDRGVLELATSEHLGSITRLDLAYGTLTNEGARLLASATAWLSLSYLDVRHNAIDHAGLVQLEGVAPVLRTQPQHTLVPSTGV